MSASRILGTEASTAHNHGLCVHQALEQAEHSCRQNGLRLTPIRRQVLELVWEGHHPVKAYDLIDALRGRGVRAGPPTVYRALDFLLKAGLIHRLDTVNAFIGCGAPGRPHAGLFFICQGCGDVVELDAPATARMIGAEAEGLGFQVVPQAVEILGRCRRCGDLRQQTALDVNG